MKLCLGHMFCSECLLAHRRTSGYCPSCRTEINRIIRVRPSDDRVPSNKDYVTSNMETITCLDHLIMLIEGHLTGTPVTLDTLNSILKASVCLIECFRLRALIAWASLQPCIEVLTGTARTKEHVSVSSKNHSYTMLGFLTSDALGSSQYTYGVPNHIARCRGEVSRE